MTDVKSGVGGWLLVLCGVLLVWQPVSFGLVASAALDALPVRGTPLALVLAARLLVTAVGIAAGLALAGRRPSGVAMAKASLIASAAMDLFVYATPYFPNNRAPGETPVYAAVSIAWYAGWFVYLSRSSRVRSTF
jgi:hypothetical protein